GDRNAARGRVDTLERRAQHRVAGGLNSRSPGSVRRAQPPRHAARNDRQGLHRRGRARGGRTGRGMLWRDGRHARHAAAQVPARRAYLPSVRVGQHHGAVPDRRGACRLSPSRGGRDTRMTLKIGILPGDDIGLEVVPEAVKVMRAAAVKAGAKIEWHALPIGRAGHESHGHTFPKITEEALATMDGWVQGPMGHSAYPRNDSTWVNPPTRKRYDLYANVKPVRSYPQLPSLHKDVDIVFLRETTEDLMRSGTLIAGAGELKPNDDTAIGMRVVTRQGANRVAREAFEIARTRARRKVTAVHKAPSFKLCCG